MPDAHGAAVPAPSGVAFREPPVALQPSLRAAIADAVATIPPGRNGALVGIATERGWNAAIVSKLADDWEVQAWVGKDWDAVGVTYGTVVRKSW
jgi:hypothetical protein